MNPHVTHSRSCASKIRYLAMGIANAVVSKMVEDGVVANRELASYYCRYCSGWHIGHPVRVDTSLPKKRR